MVNLKVLNAIVNAKQAAITENVYNVICEEADTKYRFNLEKIVKANVTGNTNRGHKQR